jgi:hypothetical protein
MIDGHARVTKCDLGHIRATEIYISRAIFGFSLSRTLIL